MAHPARAAFVDELLPRLPGASVVWDETGDRWDTGRRSMLAFDPAALFHLVVQDDALLCPDFLEIASEQLAGLGVLPGPVAFYAGRTNPRLRLLMQHAANLCQQWVRYPGPYWGVAVAVRTADIPDMIRWGDEQYDIPNYDRRMARYFERDRGLLCYYSAPSLVQHRTHGNPSLIEGRGWRGRSAAWYEDDPRAVWAREKPPAIGIRFNKG